MKTLKLTVALFLALSIGLVSAQVPTVSLTAAAPITPGQTSESLNINIQNASQCTASATLNGTAITLTSWSGNVCTTNTTCNNLKNSTVNNLGIGTYKFSLSCVNAPSPTNVTTNDVVITSASGGGNTVCSNNLTPSGLTAQNDVNVSFGYPNGVNSYYGTTTDFGSIFGRKPDGTSAFRPASGITPWPGVSGTTLWLSINRDQYLSIPFTPVGNRTGKFYATVNGGQILSSMTISECPGDFRETATTAPIHTIYCAKNSLNTNSVQIYWDSGNTSATSPVCHLNANKRYYLNLIQAPLTDSNVKPVSLCNSQYSDACSTQITNTIVQ